MKDYQPLEVAYRVRCSHTTDGRAVPADRPHPWRVLCKSHVAGLSSCARYAIEPLDGSWDCQECARFTWATRSELDAALTSPNFSHVTVRGHDREIGCVYHRDPTSPTGVRRAAGFDPFCPAAQSLVKARAGTPHDGPQSGRAGRP